MTTTIEREIVQLGFDAKDFRQGIRDSLKEIEDLKKGLELEKAQRSFAELEKASNIDFSAMSRGISSISSKFNVMGIVAFTAISRITNSIITNAKKMFDTLILAPITTGLDEYETQLNAIQTILANTSKHGTNLNDVTEALDELNRYADLTIYNFTQMTTSIGTFTTAGVDLDTSVSAIKGIANIAALSGSSANQASTAMYQLSQAISSGVVRLQDWMSVENAGMGGEIFKESLIETARVHGVSIDRILEQEGSFRNSLQRGWLSSEILLDTLSKFTGDLNAAQLEAMGYSAEQIAGIQEMAVMANDAATKIKTLTQLKDTLAEALQSGWSETWRIIFGDFDEAKELWGAMGNLFGDMISSSSVARNQMLDLWKAFGGRRDLIQGVFNVIEAVVNILRSFKAGISDIFPPVLATDLVNLTKNFLAFSERLKTGSESMDSFRAIVKGFAAALDIVFLVIKAVVAPIKELLSTMGPTAAGFLDTALNVSDAIVAFREFAIETGYFEAVVASIIAYVGDLVDKIKDLADEFMALDVVQDVIGWFQGLQKSDFVKLWDGFLVVIMAIVGPFVLLALAAKELYQEIVKLEIVRQIGDYFKSIPWENITDYLQDLADGAEDFINSIKDSELLAKFVAYLKTFDGRRLRDFFEDARESFGWVSDILDTIRDKMSEVTIDTDGILTGIKNVGKTISDWLKDAFDSLTDNAATVDYTKLFDVLNAGLLGAVLLSIRKLVSGGWIVNVLENAFGGGIETVGESLSEAFGAMESTLVSFQNNIKADTLQKVAISVAILAGSILLLSTIDQGKLLLATGAIATMVATLFGATGALRAVSARDSAKTSLAMLGLSISIGILALALNKLTDIGPEELEGSLIAMGAGMASLVLAMRGLGTKGPGGGITGTIATLIGLGLAINILSSAIGKFGTMDSGVLEQGLIAIGASLALLTTSMLALSKISGKGLTKPGLAVLSMASSLIILSRAVDTFGRMDPDILLQGLSTVGMILAGFATYSRLMDPKGMLESSISIGIISASLLILAEAIKVFGSISWEELLRGLVGVGAALLIIVLAANAMTGALAGAAATLVMSIAVVALAGALKLLSTLTWEELLIGLVGIAAVFVIFGVAGVLLTPVVPTLLLLGAAMLLIGAGAALFGFGLGLAATGLVAISGSAVAIGAAIGIIAAAIITVLPKIGEAIATALASFLGIIAEKSPEIIEAAQTIITGMIAGITELLPEILLLIATLIIDLLTVVADALPDIIQAGFDILLGLMKGVEDNIGEVVSTALGIVAEFIGGIADGLPDIVDSAFNLLVTFLNSIADGIEENMDDIVAAGLRIGEGIIDGLVDAIGGGLELVWNAVKELAAEALGALAAAFGLDSPSKETYAMGEYVVQGLVNGFLDGIGAVEAAFSEAAEKAQNGIKPLLDVIANDIDGELTLAPVITPVVDLGNVGLGVRAVNRSLANASIMAGVEDGYERERRGRDASQGTSDEARIVFNQNNYSPKALDPAIIYRRTRTQVARLRLAS